MPHGILKSYAISDAKILFVSLVDKAANKKQFLITKSGNGAATFQTYGRIIKADADAHYVTGIVYEPMAEDTQGNYMTEEEITKAAHWFMKNGAGVDLQHNFEPFDGATVVESYVAKCDEEIGGEQIKKGTWVMTMEITDPDIFSKIEKKEITGFSMGGSGVFSTEDVDISGGQEVEKADTEKKGILKQLASLFGFDVVEKGAVKEGYNRRVLYDNFWSAFYALYDVLLDVYRPETGDWGKETDPTKISEALTDFNDIVTNLLTENGDGIFKSADSLNGIIKAGKAISAANKQTLQDIHDSLGAFLSQFEAEAETSEEEEEEEVEVTKAELENIVTGAIAKAMSAQNAPDGAGSSAGQAGGETSAEGVAKASDGAQGATEPITQEAVEKMVQAAIDKAMNPQTEEEAVTIEKVSEMIETAVAKAMDPVLRNAGLPTNINDVEKGAGQEEVHYLHGIL